VRAARRVHLAHGGEIRTSERVGQPDQRWPEAAMHVGDLTPQEATHEDLIGVAHRPRQPKDLFALRVAPPAPANGRTGDGLGEVGHGSLSALEHDALAANEGQSSCGVHPGPVSLGAA